MVVVMPALAMHTSTSSSGGKGSCATSSARSQPPWRSSVRTSRPSAARRAAIAAPIPRAAPVTNALRRSVTMKPRSPSKEGTMTDRWFSEEELERLSRPTMDRAIEALDTGNLDEARRLCAEMKHEWQMLHDLMASGVLDLVSFIQQRLGDEGVAEAWTQSMERGWRKHHDAIVALDRRELVGLLAATWRAHSCSGVGPNPGSFTITEDDEKVTFTMNPCGSGQRLVRNGAYEGLPNGGGTLEAHDWSFGRKGFPLYCTHCSFMNESMPIQWSGYPLYPSDPPEDYSKDPCTWYWYKDPDAIPERHYSRYGAVKSGEARR